MRQPLSDIRVLDLTRILSGPFCSMMLGDMGADVIKVEAPGKGDHVRGQGAIVEGLSWYFAAFNRNKRSIVLDLHSDKGRAVLARLIPRCDVLVENFRPGVLAAMGFDDAGLERLNPSLIVASVNGYGSTGPYVDRPAFDFIAQAMSGYMSVNGTADGEPMRTAPPLTDLIAGLYAAFGVVNALRTRDATGKGQRVEAAMTNSIMSMFAYLAAGYFATGELPARTGNDHPVAAPYGLFHASDGDVAVAPSTDPVLKRFLTAIGLPELFGHPDYDTNPKRVARRAELNARINEAMRRESQAHWIETLNRAGVPCGRVQTLAEAFDDPQTQAQEMVIDVPHPGHGTVRMLGFPVKMSATPCRVARPAPDHGEHTEEVLAESGFAPDEIAGLKADGVI